MSKGNPLFADSLPFLNLSLGSFSGRRASLNSLASPKGEVPSECEAEGFVLVNVRYFVHCLLAYLHCLRAVWVTRLPLAS